MKIRGKYLCRVDFCRLICVMFQNQSRIICVLQYHHPAYVSHPPLQLYNYSKDRSLTIRKIRWGHSGSCSRDCKRKIFFSYSLSGLCLWKAAESVRLAVLADHNIAYDRKCDNYVASRQLFLIKFSEDSEKFLREFGKNWRKNRWKVLESSWNVPGKFLPE